MSKIVIIKIVIHEDIEIKSCVKLDVCLYISLTKVCCDIKITKGKKRMKFRLNILSDSLILAI